MTWMVFGEQQKKIDDPVVQRWLNPEQMPSWRRAIGKPSTASPPKMEKKGNERVLKKGKTFVLPPAKKRAQEASVAHAYEVINMALLLRRPLLVTGEPGLGKSSLAYHLAYMLDLGTPLVWAINSQSTLKDGLYHYDAVDHLRAIQEAQSGGEAVQIGSFIRLGALGTALLPWDRPRVVLIDEIDKSSYDLPNDLLNVLEDGRFVLPELRRAGSGSNLPHSVYTADEEAPRKIDGGVVQMYYPPVIVMTSNNEREFPKAFMRRCIHLRLEQPNLSLMKDILLKHLGIEGEVPAEVSEIFEELTDLQEKSKENWATDQLLQAVYIAMMNGSLSDALSVLKR